jgi:hypothetical protein
MYCHLHSQEPAKGACVHCGKLFCSDCLVEVDSKYFCKEHVKLLFMGSAGNDRHYSNPYDEKPYDERYCGAPIPTVYVQEQDAPYGYSPYSKAVAFILCLPPFGLAGFHRFYVRKTDTGLVWLCSLGLLGLGWLYDMTALSCGFFKDAYGRKLK